MVSPVTRHPSPVTACALCAQAGGEVLRDDGFARVVLVNDADHPGFCRVILNAHVKEMTDLGEAERTRLMGVVFEVEAALRELLSPEKINLACFGNLVPHLHWHVIPRFAGDPHFPNPVWGARQREGAHALPAGFARAMQKRLA
jgi:diadenosine tetraphosphate (Ap4A) HIT family hydrolase